MLDVIKSIKYKEFYILDKKIAFSMPDSNLCTRWTERNWPFFYLVLPNVDVKMKLIYNSFNLRINYPNNINEILQIIKLVIM
jgi:hypothetical protein